MGSGARDEKDGRADACVLKCLRHFMMIHVMTFRKQCKIRCSMRGRGVQPRVYLFFTVFAALYVEPCSEKRVKYGVCCEGANAQSHGCWCFTVFTALYVKPGLENFVKYGVRCAGAVSSLAFI